MEPPLPESFMSRFEVYNRLLDAADAVGEKLPILEIVALGGQSDGKSSLLEALLGFRFNVREMQMGTRRPLILQMVHEPSALEPRCRFKEEDSDDYGSPIVSSSAIAEVIKSRTDSHLKKTRTAVSPKLIVMRVEYAHCPNLTIIDTPGFVLKAKKGETYSTPDEILSMVKELATPPHRLLLFLQQSSVKWCSSLWLDVVQSVDPTLRRTIVVVSKFDNKLKEFTDRWEVDRYLNASGYLGDSTQPFFVALPKDKGVTSNEEFRRQISQVDSDIIHHLRESVKGGFDEEKYGSFIGFGRLRDYLESELQRRYKEAAPATLALLEQRCAEVAVELARADTKLQATSDVASLRRLAMLHVGSISRHVWALINGAFDPGSEVWGKTTDEEWLESGFGSWPGVVEEVKPPNSVLKLYGGAAFQRVMHEFRCATHSIECPIVSRVMVANILLAHAVRGGGGGVAGAAVEIARATARSWLAPLLDTSCDRLAYVLRSLFDLAVERSKNNESLEDERWKGSMDGFVGFHVALRHSYNQFIHGLAKQCKQLVRRHLDSVTSPYSQICYYDSDSRAHTIPEAPPPDQPREPVGAGKKDHDNIPEPRMSKWHMRIMPNNTTSLDLHQRNGNLFGGANDHASKTGSPYSEVCGAASQHFARIREVLIDGSLPSTLNSRFLTPCRDRLMEALGMDLFAVNDERFMEMVVAPGTVDVLHNERESLQKRQEMLQSCITEFNHMCLSNEHTHLR